MEVLLTQSSFDEAYGNGGARGRSSSQSKSPTRPTYMSNSYNSYDGHGQGRGAYRSDGWDAGRRGSDVNVNSNRNFDYPSIPQSLENLELEYQKDALDLGRMRDKEEDEENHRHQGAIREIRENYMKKMAVLRAEHAKRREDFLQREAQRRQQLAGQHMSASGFGGYNQQSYQEYENTAGNPHYPGPNVPMESRQQLAGQHVSASGFSGYNQQSYQEYENSAGNPHYPGPNVPMESRGRYPNPMDDYHASRLHESYGDLQRQRRDDFGKAYNRY